MNPLVLFELGSKIIDRVLPDPAAKQAATIELLKLNQAGEFKEIEAQLARDLAQVDVNKIEASSDSIFKSGWRPAVGWTCVAGFAFQFLARPLLAWGSGIWSVPSPPEIEMGDLVTLLFAMLGFGGMRMAEKLKGKA